MVLVTPYFFMEKLQELAKLYGIETEYTDFWDKKRVATKQELLKILNAMGINAETPKQIEGAIQRFKLRRARKHIDNVYVLSEDDPFLEITINCLNTEDWDDLVWSIELENKKIISNKVKKDDLKIAQNFVFNRKTYLSYKLQIQEKLPLGYHTINIKTKNFECSSKIISTPKTCYVPPCLEEEKKLWGISAQLYSLRSYWNWGIGDFSDLKKLVNIASDVGASFVGCNPLHALATHDIRGQSPYYPSSRNALEFLYIDLGLTEEFKDSFEAQEEVMKEDFQRELKNLQANHLVDYEKTKNLKIRILKILYNTFKKNHFGKNTDREKKFNTFCESNLGAFTWALFESIEESLHKDSTKFWGFKNWPKELRQPSNSTVRDFAKNHENTIKFYLYIQFLAEEQLLLISKEAEEKKLPLGIYLDMALGARKDGAETWANQDIMAHNINIGAPPDFYNFNGQDWNVGCFDPNKLKKRCYEPYIRLLQDQMKYANVLRIDHVMSLMRLYWIPEGDSAKNGVYVKYPLKDLIGIVALESQRNKCLIIGEDMGTVPEEIREEMSKKLLLSYRVLIYEKKGTDFKPPQKYPKEALVVTSVHDAPPLKAFWYAKDIDERKRINVFDSKTAEKFFKNREKEKDSLSLILKMQNIYLPEKYIHGEYTKEVNLALHSLAARTPCVLMLSQLDDLIESDLLMNLPGTYTEYPNWRNKLSIPLEEVLQTTYIREIATVIKKEGR